MLKLEWICDLFTRSKSGVCGVQQAVLDVATAHVGGRESVHVFVFTLILFWFP